MTFILCPQAYLHDALSSLLIMHGSSSLHDTIGIITDGSSSLGRATFIQAARQGARAIYIGGSSNTLGNAFHDVRRIAPSCLVQAVQMDADSDQSVERVVTMAIKAFGKLDWLVSLPLSRKDKPSAIISFMAVAR